MDKEEAIVEFLKGLRICLNNASVYFKEHPFFVKSVNEFKSKIDSLLKFIDPIRVNFTPDSLLIAGIPYAKSQLFTELAAFFHIRKIKSIELREGLTIDELLDFLSAIALAPKEILKRGGAQNIIDVEHNAHCFVEQLDYSQLLGSAGEEAKDVWMYLFGEAAQANDAQKIQNCVDNFGSVVGSLNVRDLAGDEELKKNICNFLSCLKDSQKEDYEKCSKEMFKAVFKHKDAIDPEQVEKIKAMFKGLSQDQFADLLLDGIAKDDNFDALSLQLFSRLAGEERAQGIFTSFAAKASAKDAVKDDPRMQKRVRDLLSGPDTQSVSEGYRHILASLLKDISFEKGVFFDRSQLHVNYRYILLTILDDEQKQDSLELVVSKLVAEWGNIVNDRDMVYLHSLCDIVRRKKKADPASAALFAELDKRMADFIEHMLWEEHPLAEIDYLAESLERSSSGMDLFLDRIFEQERLSPAALKLFFRSFPENTQEFYKRLEARRVDIDFLNRLIHGLKGLDPKAALEALVKVYRLVNEVIQVEILKIMQLLPEINAVFALSVLYKSDARLKKEALGILIRDAQLRRQAIAALLGIPSPLGMKNRQLIENIGLCLEAGLKESVDYLEFLKSRRFFWNRGLRQEAENALEKLNAG
jgi:hypothetical protein